LRELFLKPSSAKTDASCRQRFNPLGVSGIFEAPFVFYYKTFAHIWMAVNHLSSHLKHQNPANLASESADSAVLEQTPTLPQLNTFSQTQLKKTKTLKRL
jgi:hypothetical protein